MALKDWRLMKLPDWMSSNTIMSFRKIDDMNKEIAIEKEYNDYSVIILGQSRNSFDKKSEAIKFAKSYMRTH